MAAFTTFKPTLGTYDYLTRISGLCDELHSRFGTTGSWAAPEAIGSGTPAAGSFTTVKASSSVAMAATQKLYLDGIAASGDTYLYEISANVVDLVVGGNVAMRAISQGMGVVSLAKFFLDGGGDTYIYEPGANQADIVCGGVAIAHFTDTSFSLPTYGGGGGTVSVGAGDSGGAGFRLLRVPN